jgi:hypothetical protein
MEKAFRYGDVCEYIEYIVPYRQYGVVLGLGVGLGQTTTHCKNPACYKLLYRASDFDRFFGMT